MSGIGGAETDQVLMERVAAGDRESFAELIRRHQRLVLSITFRFLGDRAEAEDAAQEVFLRLWDSARRYRPEAPLAAYLRTLAVNHCLDIRRKARFVVLSGGEDGPGEQDPHRELAASERREALARAMQSLPPAQRIALVLFHMEGLSVKEVASLMETSSKAAESLLSRARTALRERMGGVRKSGG